MITYELQQYDKCIGQETNDICYRCKRCCSRDPDELCIWTKSKATVLPENVIVSNRINEKDKHEYVVEGGTGSYKILRCKNYIPEEQDDYTPMSEEKWSKICAELPDILYHEICKLRDRNHDISEKYNALELKYNKLVDSIGKEDKNEKDI